MPSYKAADEIQSEDPNVARILCEQAYSMAQNLDPNSDGRGVLQFKTGLMSVIKPKLVKMRKVFSTSRALTEVLEVLSRDSDPGGAGRSIREELGRIKRADATLSAELTPYNIVPLEAQSMTNATGVFPEVRGAVQAIKYAEHFPSLPENFEISGQHGADMFDLMESSLGFSYTSPHWTKLLFSLVAYTFCLEYCLER